MTDAKHAATRSWNGVEVPEPGTYAIDTAHSQVGFVVRHLMVSKVRGRFGRFSGTIEIAEDPADSSVTTTIDVDSVDTGDETRDNHLRSADFFEGEAHPQITYRSTGFRHAGGDRFLLDGELTVHGVTRPIQLDVEYAGVATDPWGGQRIGFSASGEVDREDFGLTWNQALETGGVLVGKKATLEIEVEAVRQ